MAKEEIENNIGLFEDQTESGSQVESDESFFSQDELTNDNSDTDSEGELSEDADEELTNDNLEESDSEFEPADEDVDEELTDDNSEESDEQEDEDEFEDEADETETETEAGQQEAVSETSDVQEVTDKEDKGHDRRTDTADPEYEYVKQRIRPDLIAGTNEFFDSIADDARAKVEELTGEEFDEFDQKHQSRFQYYIGVFAEERKQEMHRTIDILRQEYAHTVRQKKQAEAEQNLMNYLNSELKTVEEKEAFRNICNRMPHEDFTKMDSMISNGDLSGVKAVVARIKNAKNRTKQVTRNTPKQRPAVSDNRPNRNAQRPKLSDLFR